MSFQWPALLALLLLLLPCALLYARLDARRRLLAARFGELGLAVGAARALGLRRHLPPALLLAGLAVLIVALARPQAVVSLPRAEGTVILVFDVSGSMAAADVEPTRMEAAKAAALDFVERQPASVRVGVVAFSDNGFMVQAPSADPEPVRAAINRLNPERGTSLGHGLLTALNTLAADLEQGPSLYSSLAPQGTPTPAPLAQRRYASAVIVVLSDGDNNEAPDPLAAAQAAADLDVRVHTVGLGSADGATLILDGFHVHTRLNETLLQQIAQSTGGTYYPAENQDALREVYENLDRELVVRPEAMELTALLAGAGLLALLAGGALSLWWHARLP